MIKVLFVMVIYQTAVQIDNGDSILGKDHYSPDTGGR